MIADVEIEALGERGFFVLDRFLGTTAALAARSEALALPMTPAGVSRGSSHRVDPEVRGDHTTWIDPSTSGPALRALEVRFEELQSVLRERAFLPLRRREIQAARYGAGAAYARHSDVSPGEPGRIVTAIVYLVPESFDAARDGGVLRLFTPEPVEIEPKLDRLLVFRSELEHEVLVARGDRLAITCWYRGADRLPA